MTEPQAPAPRQRARRPVELNLLRPVPGDTPVHRLGSMTLSSSELVEGDIVLPRGDDHERVMQAQGSILRDAFVPRL